MKGKRLCVLLLTYNRLEYALATLRSTLHHVQWDGYVGVHIASDGDTDEYIDHLKDACATFNIAPAVSNSQRSGYGANYNLATQTVHTWADYVLVLEDDWRLERDLDADLFASALDELQAGCIRMGYIGFTQLLKGEFAASVGNHWLRLDPSSPEPHVFAGHPRLETVAWQRSVGPWPEGLEPGQTEFAVAHIAEARHGVIWPIQQVNVRGDLFVHIGTERSW